MIAVAASASLTVDVQTRFPRAWRIARDIVRQGALGDFEAVAHAVAVGVVDVGLGPVGVDLRRRRQAVAIGVGDERIGAVGAFHVVVEAVVVGVLIGRIGAVREFLGVGPAVGYRCCRVPSVPPLPIEGGEVESVPRRPAGRRRRYRRSG